MLNESNSISKTNDNEENNQLEAIDVSKSNNSSIANETMTNSNETNGKNDSDKGKHVEIKYDKDTIESTTSERNTCMNSDKRIKMKNSHVPAHDDK